MSKQCSKCKASFSCQNETGGCWCQSVQLAAATLQALRESFADCLCPTCLQALDERGVNAATLPNHLPGEVS